ncbi:MAG: hypothetical protein E7396_07815 [Ruminococcaceae bacterium]|nr:hypothetical protein [Oscillospiraceae bacterium]
MRDKAFESFINPDKIYHGTDFWMLNDKLEEDEIVRQLNEMKKQGVYTFIARTYVGLKSDYPGPDFQSKLRVIVDTARELDMKVFLQAGYMPEDVTGLPSEFSLDYIKVYKKEDDIPQNEEIIAHYNEVVFTRWNSEIFLDMFDSEAMDFYVRQSYEDVWSDFKEDFGKTILSIWVDEPSYKGEFLPFPRSIEEKFYEKYGYSVTEIIPSLYYDIEGYETVRYHYRKLLQDLLEENYFKRIRLWCNEHSLMASGHLMLEDSLSSQIFRAGATMPFYKYFDIPGMDVLFTQQNWKRCEIKNKDGRDYTYREMVMNTPMQVSSVARQMGSEHILCEMYGVTTNNLTFRNQKYMFDFLAAHGINHRSVHGIFYSLKGRGKRLYPAHVNYYQPYWDDVHIISDYVASVSRFISLGKPDGETVVIHPLDSAFCEYTCNNASDITGRQPSRDALEKRDAAFLNLTNSLCLSGCIFDYGDERSIERDSSIEGNLFRIGKMYYDTVVLPDLIQIQKTTLDKIIEFSKNGGRVIVQGGTPHLLDGNKADCDLFSEVANPLYVEEISQLIPLLKTDKYTVSCEEEERNIMVRRRTDGDDSYYYLFNADGQEEKHITLTIDGLVMAEEWNPFTKCKKSVSYIHRNEKTEIRLILEKGSNALIHTVKISEEKEDNKTQEHPLITVPLRPEFEVSRNNPNVLLMEYCSFKKGNGEYSGEYPVTAVQQMLVNEDYNGELTQRFTFFAEREFEGLELAIEDALNHRVIFNGEEIPVKINGYYMAKAFERISLPKSQKGTNVIELKQNYIPLEKIRRKISSLFETRHGVELEAVYLLGDFSVNMMQEPTRNGDLRYSRRNILLSEEKKVVSGELTKEGYPFYAGCLSLKKKFDWTGNTDGLSVCLEELDGCICHVNVNGIDCGSMYSYPLKVDISKAVVQGENIITFKLINTLRNLLGPWHRPEGEIGAIRSHYGDPDSGWMGIAYNNDTTWYDNRVPDTKFWTDSYMLTPLGLKDIRLEKKL